MESTTSARRKRSAPKRFGQMMTACYPARRIGYHLTIVQLGAIKTEVRFHFTRHGGRESAATVCARFIRAANRELAPIFADIRSSLRLKCSGKRTDSHLLPPGVNLHNNESSSQTVVATARREVLGRISVEEHGLKSALNKGCDLRISLHRSEIDANTQLAMQASLIIESLAEQFGGVIAMGKSKHHSIFGAGFSRIPHLEIVPRESDGHKFAYEVRMDSIFTALFTWSPYQAMTALERAERFARKAQDALKHFDGFIGAFRSGGKNPKPKKDDLPPGIRVGTSNLGAPIVEASWKRLGQANMPGTSFSVNRYGFDRALKLAKEARASGMRKLARNRTTVGMRMINEFSQLATKAGVSFIAADRPSLAAMLPIAA